MKDQALRPYYTILTVTRAFREHALGSFVQYRHVLTPSGKPHIASRIASGIASGGRESLTNG